MFDINSFKKHGYYFIFLPHTQYSYKGNEITVYIDRNVLIGNPAHLITRFSERPRAAAMEKDEIEAILSLIGFDMNEAYAVDLTMHSSDKTYRQEFQDTRIGKVIHEQLEAMKQNGSVDNDTLIKKIISLIWPGHEEFCIHDYFFKNVNQDELADAEDHFIGIPLKFIPVEEQEFRDNIEYLNSFIEEKEPVFKKVFGNRKTAALRKELEKQLDRRIMEQSEADTWRYMLTIIYDMYCISTIEAQIRHTPSSAHPSEWTISEVQDKLSQLQISNESLRSFDFTESITKRNQALTAKAC